MELTLIRYISKLCQYLEHLKNIEMLGRTIGDIKIKIITFISGLKQMEANVKIFVL